jgi:ABC-type antimicrobial peptide transport system permease subunit
LVFQFSLAFITILSGVIFTQNSNYQRDQEWGYNETQVIGVPIESEKHYTALRNKLTQNPDIELVSGAASHVGKRYSLINLEFQTRKLQTASFQVGFDYLETLGLQIDEGRSFDKTIESDKVESVIVTDLFAKEMGWVNALNQEVKIDSSNYFVIGVLSNFYFEGFYDKMIPAVFMITPEENFRFIAMKVAAGEVSKTEEYVAGVWKEVEPDLPYEGFLQNEVFDYFFNEMRANNQLMAFIAGMALVLACMGLFGLVSFNISRKMKEYSIRRVLGANLTSITRSVNNDFVWYLIIAGIIGAPVAYMLMNMLLQSIFELVMPMTAWPFVIAFGSVIFTAYLTISSQILKVSRNNPADTLRNE